MGLEKNVKTNEEDVKEIMKNVNSKETIDNLNYVAENVLITYDKEEQGKIGLYAEKIGRDNSKEHAKKGFDYLSKNNILEEGLEVDSGIMLKKYGFVVNKDVSNEVKKLKIQLNDKTKETLRKAFSLIDKMTDINDKPIISSEKIDSTGSIFNNFYEINDKIREIIESRDMSRMDELTSLTNKHKEYSKNLDDLIEITNEYDSEAFVANSSVARISNLSAKYVENIKGASRANNLFIIANYIKASGCSVEEYLEDPLQVFKKYAEKRCGFEQLNKYANEKGDEEFIRKVFANESEYGETARKVSQDFAPSLRYLIGSSMFQTENQAENRFAADVYNSLVASEMSYQAGNFSKNYFKDNQLQTTKNILINTDKNKDYIALCASSVKYNDPFSGKESGTFDYEKFVKEGKVDVNALSEKFENLEKTNNPLIKDAMKSISRDILKSKQYENTIEFDKIQKFAGVNSIQLYDKLRGRTNYKKFIEAEYSELNKGGFKKENINKSLTLAKAISEKFNSRTRIGKALWGRNEGKLLNKIKNDLTENGFNKEKIESYLIGKATKEEVVNINVKNENKANLNRVSIKVDECKVTDSASKQKSVKLENTLNKEKVKDIGAK